MLDRPYFRDLASRRPRFTLRLTALTLVVLGPIALGGWDLNGLPPRADDPRVAAQAAAYRRARNPVVDRLLPEGGGGTHFYETLGGPVGQAYVDAAVIGLTVGVVTAMWPESIELHERAHLARGFLPREVDLLMGLVRTTRPDRTAEDPAEHFAQMAERAWEVVAPPRRMSIQQTPLERLREAEASVPGTAGFVVWYLQHMSMPKDVARELAADAARLAPRAREWDELWSALDARRQADGTFRPWPPKTAGR